MSYPLTSSAIQPRTGTSLIDFVSGPFAAFSKPARLAILKVILPIFEQCPTYNAALILKIIAEIKVLSS